MLKALVLPNISLVTHYALKSNSILKISIQSRRRLSITYPNYTIPCGQRGIRKGKGYTLQPRYCAQCGQGLQAIDKFCGRCGAATGELPLRNLIPSRRIALLTILSGGLYIFYWFYITWKQYHDHFKADDDAYPIWHALALLVPVYGAFRTHAHMRAYKDAMLQRGVATAIAPWAAVVAVAFLQLHYHGVWSFTPIGMNFTMSNREQDIIRLLGVGARGLPLNLSIRSDFPYLAYYLNAEPGYDLRDLIFAQDSDGAAELAMYRSVLRGFCDEPRGVLYGCTLYEYRLITDAGVSVITDMIFTGVIAWLLISTQSNINRYWQAVTAAAAPSRIGAGEVILTVIGAAGWLTAPASIYYILTPPP